MTVTLGACPRGGASRGPAGTAGARGRRWPLHRALAAEVARDGILANCVAPGFVLTGLVTELLDEEGQRQLAAEVPIGRLAEPDEIAAFIVWLCGPENTYISGQTLLIDGGFTQV